MKRCEEVGLVVIDNCALDSGDHGVQYLCSGANVSSAIFHSVSLLFYSFL